MILLTASFYMAYPSPSKASALVRFPESPNKNKEAVDASGISGQR